MKRDCCRRRPQAYIIDHSLALMFFVKNMLFLRYLVSGFTISKGRFDVLVKENVWLFTHFYTLLNFFFLTHLVKGVSMFGFMNTYQLWTDSETCILL